MTENSERAIGRLEGKLDALVGAVEDQTEKSEKRSARIYEELERIRLDATQSRRDIGDLKARLDDAAPVVAEVKRWKERFIGMQMMWTFLAATMGGALVAFWKWILIKLGF